MFIQDVKRDRRVLQEFSQMVCINITFGINSGIEQEIPRFLYLRSRNVVVRFPMSSRVFGVLFFIFETLRTRWWSVNDK